MPEGPETELTELTVVCGVDRRAAAGVAAALRARHTRTAVLVTHDMRALGEGVVRRRVVEDDGEHDAVLELAHACVSCTLREDLLRCRVRLARDPDVAHVVLLLDPGVEVEATCEALHGLVPEGLDRRSPTCSRCAVWSPCSTPPPGSTTRARRRAGRARARPHRRRRAHGRADRGGTGRVRRRPGGRRAVAGAWDRVRLDAVLARLAPRARQAHGGRRTVRRGRDAEIAAARRPARRPARRRPPGRPRRRVRVAPARAAAPGARRRGLVAALGHRRPFHPERLHAAFDVLLHGTIRVRGRVWVASQPEHVLWLESAGGALQIGVAGTWFAADPTAWDDADDERRAGRVPVLARALGRSRAQLSPSSTTPTRRGSSRPSTPRCSPTRSSPSARSPGVASPTRSSTGTPTVPRPRHRAREPSWRGVGMSDTVGFTAVHCGAAGCPHHRRPAPDAEAWRRPPRLRCALRTGCSCARPAFTATACRHGTAPWRRRPRPGAALRLRAHAHAPRGDGLVRARAGRRRRPVLLARRGTGPTRSRRTSTRSPPGR